MTVLDLETAADTYDCKRPNCDRPARSNRGTYAFLCDLHADERRADVSARIRAGIRRKAASGELSGPESGSEPTRDRDVAGPTRELSGPENGAAPDELPDLGAIADRIPVAARRVEEKLLRRRAARDEARDAIRVLNDALGELRAAVQALA